MFGWYGASVSTSAVLVAGPTRASCEETALICGLKVHSRISPPGARFVAFFRSRLIVLVSRWESLGSTRVDEVDARLCRTMEDAEEGEKSEGWRAAVCTGLTSRGLRGSGLTLSPATSPASPVESGDGDKAGCASQTEHGGASGFGGGVGVELRDRFV